MIAVVDTLPEPKRTKGMQNKGWNESKGKILGLHDNKLLLTHGHQYDPSPGQPTGPNWCSGWSAKLLWIPQMLRANRNKCVIVDHPAQIGALDEKLNLGNVQTVKYLSLQEFCISLHANNGGGCKKIEERELCLVLWGCSYTRTLGRLHICPYLSH